MTTIIPFDLTVTPVQTLNLPASATILSVATLFDSRIVAYVLMRDHTDYSPRYLHMVGTSTIIDPADITGRRFLGTVQLNTGMVYHLFEQRPGFTL